MKKSRVLTLFLGVVFCLLVFSFQNVLATHMCDQHGLSDLIHIESSDFSPCAIPCASNNGATCSGWPTALQNGINTYPVGSCYNGKVITLYTGGGGEGGDCDRYDNGCTDGTACCTPETCASANTITCGQTYNNNCGQSCGTGTKCNSGYTCTNNVCVANCVPKTCALNYPGQCGSALSNGCGGTLNCANNCNAGTHCDQGQCVSNSKSATFVSKINNTGGSANYGIATWTADTQAGTSIKVKIRTSNDPNMIGAQDWTTCDFVTNGQDISSNNCVHDGNKYIQYWLNLSTNDQAITPVFKDMTISYGICNEICSVRSGFSCPSGQIGILSLTDDDDAHATLYGSNTFGYSLCCENIAGTVTNSDGCGSNTYLVSLSSGSISEQHAGNSTYYANDICLSGTQFTGCYFADSGSYNYGCGTDTCFMSLSSQTDAHVGSCNSPFTKKVCCQS